MANNNPSSATSKATAVNKTTAAHKRTGSLRIQRLHIGEHILLIIWSLIVLFPLYVMVVNSFKDRLSIYINPFALPEHWHPENYAAVLGSGDFLNYFKNSFIAVISSLALVMLFGSFASYAFANWRSKPARVLFFFMIAGMMLPIRMGSIRLLQLMRSLGLLNTLGSLIPIYVAMGVPIAVFVLTEFIREIPLELTEAALVDGAGRFYIFGHIITPLIRPALATVGIYNLVPFWNDLWFPLIMIQDERAKTLLLGVTRLFGQYQTDWSRVLAVLTLSAIPVIALYLAMSKQFIAGLTAGAVKG